MNQHSTALCISSCNCITRLLHPGLGYGSTQGMRSGGPCPCAGTLTHKLAVCSVLVVPGLQRQAATCCCCTCQSILNSLAGPPQLLSCLCCLMCSAALQENRGSGGGVICMCVREERIGKGLDNAVWVCTSSISPCDHLKACRQLPIECRGGTCICTTAGSSLDAQNSCLHTCA